MSKVHSYRRAGAVAGLLLTWVLSGGAATARAGMGIIVSDPILIPVEDPLTEYDFKLSLDSGDQVLRYDSLTLLNVPLFAGAQYVFVRNGSDKSADFTISTGLGSTPGTTSVQLQLTDSLDTFSNYTSAPIPLGDLYILTTADYPPPPGSPIYDPIFYTSRTHLTSTGLPNVQTGVVQAQVVGVPEPSSLALLALGGTSVAAVVRRRRRPA